MVSDLVAQLQNCPSVCQIIVTHNIPDGIRVQRDNFVNVIDNFAPKGFGANHNSAFRVAYGQYFCVLNPDVRLPDDPFPTLLRCVKDHDAAITAPLILSPKGEVEDSARYFPTISALLQKAIGLADSRYPAPADMTPFFPDWVAGMFLLFRSADFARLGGFDERYFLYYEDVDICARARHAGMKVVVCPSVSVIHDARRASRRSLRYMRWHLASMARYLWTARRIGS
jgi:N-acetylglucosaminyl-diphospho-decaprenol L-rhamnosyltransferase